jgi:hypothetical protein
MLHALSWLLVFIVMAMWSLCVWALHELAIWSATNAESLAAHAAGMEMPKLPEWLTLWIPPQVLEALQSLTVTLWPTVASIVAEAPSWVGGLSTALWVMWGIGCLLLMTLGCAAHALIAWLRRTTTAPADSMVKPSAAN